MGQVRHNMVYNVAYNSHSRAHCVLGARYFTIKVVSHKKVPNVIASLSYQKKDGCAWPRSPFFWYDTNFLEYFFYFCLFFFFSFFSEKVGVIPKEGWARPSFGMTATQDIRDIFV